MKNVTFTHVILLVIALGAVGVLAACQPATAAEEDPFVVADLFSTPGKALATVALSPTPAPTNTLPSDAGIQPTLQATLPLPTLVILQQPTQPLVTSVPQQPTSPPATARPTNTPDLTANPVTPTPDPGQPTSVVGCATVPDMPFTPIYQNIEGVASALGCPDDGAFQMDVVYQTFETGAMVFVYETEDIIVLSNAGINQGQRADRWWRFEDEYDGEEEPDLDPPDGLLQPIRGFGHVWNNNAFVRDALGWATGPETQVTVAWQRFDNGWMMHGPGGAPIYAMRQESADGGIHSGPLP